VKISSVNTTFIVLYQLHRTAAIAGAEGRRITGMQKFSDIENDAVIITDI